MVLSQERDRTPAHPKPQDPWLPIRIGMLDRYESAGRVQRLAQEGGRGVPTLSLHGELDEVAPIELGRQLYTKITADRLRSLSPQIPRETLHPQIFTVTDLVKFYHHRL